MNQVICAVHDQAVGQYLTPFIVRSEEEAIRMFKTAVQDHDHDFAKHAPDFTLFAVGTFDPGTGKITSYTIPSKLGQAVQFVQSSDQTDKTDLVAEMGTTPPD